MVKIGEEETLMNRKQIIFTGGGTAGHVMVNMAIIPEFIKDGWDVDILVQKLE